MAWSTLSWSLRRASYKRFFLGCILREVRIAEVPDCADVGQVLEMHHKPLKAVLIATLGGPDPFKLFIHPVIAGGLPMNLIPYIIGADYSEVDTKIFQSRTIFLHRLEQSASIGAGVKPRMFLEGARKIIDVLEAAGECDFRDIQIYITKKLHRVLHPQLNSIRNGCHAKVPFEAFAKMLP